ncbi:alpha-actinin A [Biomphalaria glabrata]|nr:alpha-actinin A [Biomphalaria glabrata]
MGNKVDKMVSRMKEGVDSLVKEQLPVDSLVKKLRGQDCGCTNSGDGDAGDLSALCVCVVGKSCGCDFQDEKRDGDCCDDLNGMYRVERKETNEVFVTVVPVTSTLTEVCYLPEVFVPVVPVTNTSMSRTDQDNVGSAFEPVAVDFKDLCLSAGAHEGNSKLDNSIQKFSMNCTCGASHIEFRCQENHQQRICTSTIIIDIGIDECQSNHSKSELSRERHFPLEPEETYLLDVRLLSEDDFGALDFACNVAASEPEAPLRGVCREGLLRQRVRSTAVLKKTVLDPISLCGKRPRHYRNNSLVNWRKRQRHWKKTMRMASWGTRSLPPVAPTDRPPPELSNLSCSVSFRDEKCLDGGNVMTLPCAPPSKIVQKEGAHYQ